MSSFEYVQRIWFRDTMVYRITIPYARIILHYIITHPTEMYHQYGLLPKDYPQNLTPLIFQTIWNALTDEFAEFTNKIVPTKNGDEHES